MAIFFFAPPQCIYKIQFRRRLSKLTKSNDSNSLKYDHSHTGVGFFCPHNHTHRFEIKAKQGEGFYRKLDCEYIAKIASAIMAIPGWETSNGAKAEIEFAKELGLPIFYPRSTDDLDEVKAWSQTD